MTTIISKTVVGDGPRLMQITTADPTATYRREFKNGLVVWYLWNGSAWEYMETGWRSLEALFQAS